MRSIVLAVGAMLLGSVLLLGVAGLPPVGLERPADGDEIVHVAPSERAAQNTVTAIVFDSRGLDTLGELFLFFASSTATVMLLRMQRQGEESGGPVRHPRLHQGPSPSVRMLGLLLLPVVMVYGFNMILHAQVTPGGGFQGAILLGSALVQVFLVSEYRVFRRVLPHRLAELADGAGALGYVAIGALGVLVGARFLENVLPLGEAGQLLSAGTLFALNLAVALEIVSGLVLIFHEFLEQVVHRGAEE